MRHGTLLVPAIPTIIASGPPGVAVTHIFSQWTLDHTSLSTTHPKCPNLHQYRAHSTHQCPIGPYDPHLQRVDESCLLSTQPHVFQYTQRVSTSGSLRDGVDFMMS